MTHITEYTRIINGKHKRHINSYYRFDNDKGSCIIRIIKYINEASIHFRNESDVAEFLLIAGE